MTAGRPVPRAMLVLGLLAGACAGPGGRPAGQDVGTVVARFEDARALAVGPGGTLFVVDAAESAVVVLEPDGRVGAVLGGPGVGEGAFLDPVDVDPTNGQAIFVADAGAGTVTHVTAEGRTAETVAVPEVDASRSARAVGPVLRASRGRPIAVAAAPDGALYVVEAERDVVLRLDDQRGIERVLGGAGAGPAALARPVDLAVSDDGTLWVADPGRGVVQAFDPFGAAGRAIPVDEIGGPVAVEAVGDDLLVVGPAAFGRFTSDGERTDLQAVRVGEPLVGAAVTAFGVYALTRTRLIRLDTTPDP